MTIRFSEGDQNKITFAEKTEVIFNHAAEDLFAVIDAMKKGETADMKNVAGILRELRALFRHALDERKKLEEFSRQGGAGSASGGGRELDFDAARAEIGRRLARLRDAGNG